MAHDDLFSINIAIVDMHRLTARILYVSNVFQNKHVSLHERVCVSPPPYYIYWFERSFPNVPPNLDDDNFCLQCMNKIQVTKPAGRKWNRLIDEVVTMINIGKGQFIMLSTTGYIPRLPIFLHAISFV